MPTIPQNETECIEKIIASYPLGPSNICAWAQANADWSKFRVFVGMPCHAKMDLMAADTYDVIISGIMIADDVDKAYQNMLITGPFRSYSDKISLEQYPGGWVTRCVELDKWPANVLFNYMVASRQTHEHSRVYMEDFGKLIAVGMDPMLALMLAVEHSTMGTDTNGWETPYQMDRKMDAHWWYDITAKWSNLFEGTFSKKDVSNQSYKANPSKGRPTNKIWGTEDFDVLKTRLGWTALKISEEFGLRLPVVEEPEPEAPLTPVEPYVKKVWWDDNDVAYLIDALHRTFHCAPGANGWTLADGDEVVPIDPATAKPAMPWKVTPYTMVGKRFAVDSNNIRFVWSVGPQKWVYFNKAMANAVMPPGAKPWGGSPVLPYVWGMKVVAGVPTIVDANHVKWVHNMDKGWVKALVEPQQPMHQLDDFADVQFGQPHHQPPADLIQNAINNAVVNLALEVPLDDF